MKKFVLDRAIPVAGMNHIIDNLTHEVHVRAMKSWPIFVVHLGALMSLLCTPARLEPFTQRPYESEAWASTHSTSEVHLRGMMNCAGDP